MSMSPPAPDQRRVRHQAREAVALMAFSASVSLGIAALFLVVTALGHQG
ncbi:MAG: hypothetical protein LH468_08890 [Nocardioides sp.]|nr:hypothetical protein [Nocardioides sp.]